MRCVKQIGLLILLVTPGLFSCKTARKTAGGAPASVGSLRFINEYDVPFRFQYGNTTVGGLSGIDYDAARDQYYLICDDRSAINPARFYTAKLRIGSRGIDSVAFVKVTTLLQPDGQPFPDSKKDPLRAPDPEAIRFNARQGLLVWSSEGERQVSAHDTTLQDPAIIAIDTNGAARYRFPIPPNLRMQAGERGPRRNGVFEGLTFSADEKYMYVSVEEPLYEDGPRAGTGDSSGWVRILKYDVERRVPTAQYAYRIDPVAHPPTPPGAFIVNGIPDILLLDKDHLLVMERSFSTGHLNCTIKLYIADISKAGDVSGIPSLASAPPAHPVPKKLLLNLDSLHIYIDNVEGATFGPRLPNGHRTLVLVADNNFEPLEKTQFLLFEVVPGAD